MNIISLLSLISLIFVLNVGIIVYIKNPTKKVNIYFLILCLYGGYWTFSEFGFAQSISIESAIFWTRFYSFWPILMSILLHFILIFTERTKWLQNKITLVFVYTPAILYSIGYLVLDPYIIVVKPWGWYRTNEYLLFSNLSDIWFIGISIIILYFLFDYTLKITNKRKKKQSLAVLIGFLIPILINIIDIILQSVFNRQHPNITTFGVIIGFGFIAYGIWKYELFRLSPVSEADNIISTMTDLLILTDEKSKIQFINESVEKMIKCKKEEIIGTSITNFLEIKFHDIKHTKSMNNFEANINIKNREKIPVSVSSSILREKNKKIYGYIFIARDITQQKKIEQDLIIKSDSLEQMNFDLKSKNKEILAMNEQLLTIQLQLKKANNELIKNQKDRENYVTKLKEKSASLQIFNEKLNKSQKEIQLINKKLLKLDELKSAFLNITSHELRTPMTSIKGYVQMFLKKLLGDITKKQEDALHIILRNVNRLDHLIQDILDISRLESGTMKFIPEPISLCSIIKEVEETMKTLANDKKIMINIDCIGEIPEIIVDSDRIKQVIINLINNAIKFSPENSNIHIHTHANEDHVFIDVQDFGRGIPKKNQKDIFNTFYQVDSGMDRKFGGAGLGLAISRGIVLAHGGEICVESEGVENKGSIFHIKIPILPVTDVEKQFKKIDMFQIEA